MQQIYRRTLRSAILIKLLCISVAHINLLPSNFPAGNSMFKFSKEQGVNFTPSSNVSIVNFEHVNAGQVNALMRLKRFLGFEEKKQFYLSLILNSFILSNFNYCSFVWRISSAKFLNKVENLQKRALHFCRMTTVVHTKNYLKSQEKHHECCQLL